jgi:hypothetical protein
VYWGGRLGVWVSRVRRVPRASEDASEKKREDMRSNLVATKAKRRQSPDDKIEGVTHGWDGRESAWKRTWPITARPQSPMRDFSSVAMARTRRPVVWGGGGQRDAIAGNECFFFWDCNRSWDIFGARTRDDARAFDLR